MLEFSISTSDFYRDILSYFGSFNDFICLITVLRCFLSWSQWALSLDLIVRIMATVRKNNNLNAIEIITIDDDDDEDIIIVENPLDPLSLTLSPNGLQQSLTVPSINGNTPSSPITKELTFNGPKKNFVLNSSIQNQDELSTSSNNTLKSRGSDYYMAQVQCPRCKCNVCVETFREHIDACPPRKNNHSVLYVKRSEKKKSKHDDGPPDLSDSLYSNFEYESKTVKDVKFNIRSEKPPIANTQSLNKNTPATSTISSNIKLKYTARKSTSSKNQFVRRHSVDLDSGLRDTNNDDIQTQKEVPPGDNPQKTSQSYCFSGDSNSNKNNAAAKETNDKKKFQQSSFKINPINSRISSEKTSKSSSESWSREKNKNNDTNEINHGSQLAYYKKFLEVRNKSLGQKTQETQEANAPEDILNESLEVSLLLQDNTFACRICSFTTDKQRTLFDHERNHQRNKKKIYQCAYCDQKYTKFMLNAHINNVHPGQKFALLEETSSKISGTDSPPILERIDADQSEKVQSIKRDKISFPCDKCSYRTHIYSRLRRHTQSHIKSPNLPLINCSLCDFKSIMPCLVQHIKYGHKKPPKDSVPVVQNSKHLNVIKTRQSEPSYKSMENLVVNGVVKGRQSEPSNKRIDHSGIKDGSKPLAKPDRVPSPVLKGRKNGPAVEPIGNSANTEVKGRKSEPSNKTTENLTNSEVQGRKSVPAIKPTLNKSVPKQQVESTDFTPIRKDVPTKPNKSKTILYQCDLCSFSSTNKFALENSHRDTHKRQPLVQCDSCNFKSTPRCLKVHQFLCTKIPKAKSELLPINQKKPDTRTESLERRKKSEPRIEPLETGQRRTESKKLQVRSKSLEVTRKKPEASIELSETRSERPSIKLSIFNCSQCEFSTSLRIKLNSHINKCHSTPGKRSSAPPISAEPQIGSGSLRCRECSYIANSLFDLNAHKQKPHLTLYQCGMCSFFAIERALFNKHINSHKGKNIIITCGKCCYKSTQSYLTAHLKLHQNIQRTEDGPYKCDLCSHVSRKSTALKKHYPAHKTQPFQKCPLCVYKSTHRSVLFHIRHSHVTNYCTVTTSELLDLPESNSISPRNLAEPPVLERMDISDSEETPAKPDSKLQCDVCNKVFKTPSVLTIHVNEKHNRLDGPPFKCKLCSASFKVQATLTKHSWFHKKNAPIIKCKYCDFKSTNSQVTKHTVICPQKYSLSSPEVPESPAFHCSVCSYSTKLRIKLKMHLKAKHSMDVSPVKKCDVGRLSSTQSANKPKRKRAQDVEAEDDPTPKKAKVSTEDSSKVRTRSKSMSEVKKTAPEPRSSLPSDDCVNKLDQRTSSNDTLSCSICSYSGSALKNHLSSHKTFNSVILQCHYCGHKASDSTLKRHVCTTEKSLRRIEPMKVRLDCDKCSFTTYFPLDYFEHKTNCTANKSGKNIGAIKSFKCEFCSFTSFWQYLIDRHTDSHTLLKLPIEQCPYCDFRSTPVALLAHKNKCISKK